MFTNKQADKYFFQQRHINTLEGILEETRDSFKAFQRLSFDTNFDRMIRNNPVVCTQEQADVMLQDNTLPVIRQLFSVEPVKNVQVSLFGRSFWEDAKELQHDVWKWYVGYAGAATATSWMMGIPLAKSGLSIAAVSLSLPVVTTLSLMQRLKSSQGFVRIIHPNRCFVRSDHEHLFSYALSHEVTHSLHFQHYLKEKTLAHYLLSNHSYCTEGLAEYVSSSASSVLGLLSKASYGEIGSFFAYRNLYLAYKELCADVGTQPKGFGIILPFFDTVDQYALGHAVYSLLANERGESVVSEVMKGKSLQF